MRWRIRASDAGEVRCSVSIGDPTIGPRIAHRYGELPATAELCLQAESVMEAAVLGLEILGSATSRI